MRALISSDPKQLPCIVHWKKHVRYIKETIIDLRTLTWRRTIMLMQYTFMISSKEMNKLRASTQFYLQKDILTTSVWIKIYNLSQDKSSNLAWWDSGGRFHIEANRWWEVKTILERNCTPSKILEKGRQFDCIQNLRDKMFLLNQEQASYTQSFTSIKNVCYAAEWSPISIKMWQNFILKILRVVLKRS